MCSSDELVIIKRLSENQLLSSASFLHSKYVENGLSIAQIAKEISSSKSSVRDALIRAEIPMREPHQPHGNKSQQKFGQQKIKGKIQPHKGEESTIQIIIKLHEEGLSFRKICSILQQMGIKTKNKNRKWHPEMIKRVLKNLHQSES